METPLVSIIIPCFNSEKFIAETVRSVQKKPTTTGKLSLLTIVHQITL
jgi:GT2 family glycosyltransferase